MARDGSADESAAATLQVDHYPEPPPAARPRGYDWDDREDLVAPAQLRTDCYRTVHGDVAIRQERDFYDDEDALILIRPEFVERLIAKLREAAGLDDGDTIPDPPQPR